MNATNTARLQNALRLLNDAQRHFEAAEAHLPDNELISLEELEAGAALEKLAGIKAEPLAQPQDDLQIPEAWVDTELSPRQAGAHLAMALAGYLGALDALENVEADTTSEKTSLDLAQTVYRTIVLRVQNLIGDFNVQP